MTQEELTKLRSMTKLEILRKYWPRVIEGKLSPKAYEKLINEGRSDTEGHPQSEDDSHGPNDKGNDEGTNAAVSPSNPSPDETGDGAVSALIESFGGSETTHDERSTGLAQKKRVLQILLDLQPHDRDELVAKVYFPGAGSARLAARVLDLRKEGWQIPKAKKQGRKFFYRLESKVPRIGTD